MSPAATTSLYALIGQPVAGNPTQEMMEAAFAAAGIDARYVSLEVEADAVADAVRGIRGLGLRGVHVTVPHKVAVVGLIDRLTEAARLSGAVNCIKQEHGELVGDNTDGRGFLVSLQRLVDPAGARIVVLGAGGAARAVAAELTLAGARSVTVVNRTLAAAESVAAALGERVDAVELSSPWVVPDDADIVVHATTVGMGDPSAGLALEWPHRAGVAADVVIDPPRTAFLHEAAAAGRRTLDGLGMLVEQAVFAVRWWTGVDPDRAVMREAVVRELGLKVPAA